MIVYKVVRKRGLSSKCVKYISAYASGALRLRYALGKTTKVGKMLKSRGCGIMAFGTLADAVRFAKENLCFEYTILKCKAYKRDQIGTPPMWLDYASSIRLYIRKVDTRVYWLKKDPGSSPPHEWPDGTLGFSQITPISVVSERQQKRAS